MELFKLYNPNLTQASTMCYSFLPAKTPLKTGPRSPPAPLPPSPGALRGVSCLRFPGLCGYRRLPSWSSVLCLCVLPDLIKTDLTYEFYKVLRETKNDSLRTKFQITNVILDFSVTSNVPLVYKWQAVGELLDMMYYFSNISNKIIQTGKHTNNCYPI